MPIRLRGNSGRKQDEQGEFELHSEKVVSSL